MADEALWIIGGLMQRRAHCRGPDDAIDVGREAELARIDAFLEPGSTTLRVALIEGQPGMGKTTLWCAAIEDALDRS